MYINCHSWYSLRYGTLPIEQLVDAAFKNGVNAIALTDINNSTGAMELVRHCIERGIKPIVGIEFRNGNKLLYTAIAKNNKGFQEINEFLSAYNLKEEIVPELPPLFNNAFVIYPLSLKEKVKLRANEYFGVRLSEAKSLYLKATKELNSKCVIFQPITFLNLEQFELHKHLRAIDKNTLLSFLTEEDLAKEDEIFYDVDHLLKKFEHYPEIVTNTTTLLESCELTFDFKKIKNKELFSASKEDDRKLLQKLAYEGMKYRYGIKNKDALTRIDHELEIIDKLGFSSYFLITWDIIRYSMSRGFYHVGRGSGANSVVAYCLRITDVDPIELDLYFERFLNPKRTSPPDFDIDYSWKERDDVLDYIFKRYGKEHTALLGTINTFQGRAIIREIGKVYGLPKEEIDDLVYNRKRNPKLDDISKLVFKYGSMLQDFPNHRSIHAGGVLISEEPITCYTALDLPPKGFPTVQWDMHISEGAGFEKFDILSQRGIGHIQESVELVYKNRKLRIDAHDIPKFKKDEKVKELLRNANAIGCFYVESPSMRGLLKKLKCEDYLTLVAASSIIRPGVSKSGMMRQYIYNFHHPDKAKYIHPVMKEQLGDTYGVMVYQEDVLKVCHHFAGLDLSDADILRRAMSGKSRSKAEFQRITDKFFANCKSFGYDDEITKEVWRQVESFAGYSFAKGHSASFAVESYQSMFLKAHYPIEFMVAVINNFGGFYSTWVYINEAKKLGAKIHVPCINKSDYTTTLYGEEVYLGFIHLQSFESKIALSIIDERDKNGVYNSLENLIKRTGISLEHLKTLIQIGALRFTGKNKKNLLWEAHLLMNNQPKVVQCNELFYISPPEYELPVLEHSTLEDAYDEIELLGFPVSISFFDLLKTNTRCDFKASDLPNSIGKTVKIMGNYVCTKDIKTVKGEMMAFGTFLDIEGAFFDTTNFSQSLKRYPFQGHGIYLILGKVVEEFGFASIEVEKMAKLPIQTDPRY